MNEVSSSQFSGSTADSGHISGRELFNDVHSCLKKKESTFICAIRSQHMSQNNKIPIKRIVGNSTQSTNQKNGKTNMNVKNGGPRFVRTNTSDSIRNNVNGSYLQPPKRMNLNQRRKSIDCTYGIIRSPGAKMQRSFLLVPPKTSYSSHSDEAHEGLFPPLNNTAKSTAGTNGSFKCKSNVSNSDSLSLRAPSPNPPGRGPQTARNLGAKSPKFGLIQTSRNDTVQYRPTTNYDLNGRLTQRNVNVQDQRRPRPISSERRRSYDLVRRTFDVLPSNHNEDVNPQTTDVYNAWNGTAPKIHAIPATANQLQRRLRSSSVYSPSSGGSADKLSDRMNFNHRRRASLPCAVPLDTSNSPEFYKAVSDLCNSNKNTTNVLSSSAAATSALTNKDLTPTGLRGREALHRITEEAPTEEKDPNPTEEKQETSGVAKTPELVLPDSPNDKSRTDSAFVDCIDENSTENVIDEISKVNLNGDATLPEPVKVDKSKSRSLFYIPEPGTPFHKVSSRLKDTVEISKNEENRHFISGMPAQVPKNENIEQNGNDAYFEMLDGDDDDDFVDSSILHIPDEDLCEEDFQRKRITIWLMGVQTGDKAEQVVVSATPPPSPVPRRETAIVVVFNGDET